MLPVIGGDRTLSFVSLDNVGILHFCVLLVQGTLTPWLPRLKLRIRRPSLTLTPARGCRRPGFPNSESCAVTIWPVTRRSGIRSGDFETKQPGVQAFRIAAPWRVDEGSREVARL